MILGYGWAARGFSAATINPLDQGVVWLVAEDGHPRRVKVAYLDDAQIFGSLPTPANPPPHHHPLTDPAATDNPETGDPVAA